MSRAGRIGLTPLPFLSFKLWSLLTHHHANLVWPKWGWFAARSDSFSPTTVMHGQICQ